MHRSALILVPLQHRLAHPRRIRLAVHRIHDRPDHGTGRPHLAIADLLKHVRLSRQCLLDRRDEGTVIRHHSETVGELAVLDAGDEFGDLHQGHERWIGRSTPHLPDPTRPDPKN